MNIKIKYCLVTLVITMLFAAGCSSKESGLYRLESGTDSSFTNDPTGRDSVTSGSGTDGSVTNDPASNDPVTAGSGTDGAGINDPASNDLVTAGPRTDGPVTSDQAGGLSTTIADNSAKPGTVITSESTSVSPDVNNSAPAGTPVSTLQTDRLYVHVCGAVNTPGVYELKNGDRVFTAIRKAGGFTEEADESYINLAMAVCDGMKIDVPTVEETSGDNACQIQAVTIAQNQISSGSGTGSSGTGSASSGSGTGSQGQSGATGVSSSGSSAAASGMVNINTADISGLTSISGIGKTRAEAIISYREEHGAFISVEDIRNVSGIGDATYEKIKDRITGNSSGSDFVTFSGSDSPKTNMGRNRSRYEQDTYC